MISPLLFKKQYWPVAGTAVLLLLCYHLAFKKTLNALQLNRNLKSQLAASSDVRFQPEFEQRKNDNLNKTIALYKVDTSGLRNQILSDISIIAEKENVKLFDVPNRDPLFQSSALLVERIGFEGDYFALMKVLDHLQKTAHVGIIRSVTFDAFRDAALPTNVKKLKLSMYFVMLNK